MCLSLEQKPKLPFQSREGLIYSRFYISQGDKGRMLTGRHASSSGNQMKAAGEEMPLQGNNSFHSVSACSVSTAGH